uniref:DUF5641 domain-containing protein n=1 Tax=Rhabditophanes sp. KR3021 TaxID=114890 RepID=A0AC35UGQ7_9BILA
MSGHHRNIVPKTVVIKKIERRTPYGKLLSVVNVKSTYYDGELVDIPEESTSRISTPTTKVISTRPQSRRHQYNQRIFDESPGERTEYVLTGKNTNMFSDSTLYGDDWSSSGITQVRESHLVRSASQRLV